MFNLRACVLIARQFVTNKLRGSKSKIMSNKLFGCIHFNVRKANVNEKG